MPHCKEVTFGAFIMFVAMLRAAVMPSLGIAVLKALWTVLSCSKPNCVVTKRFLPVESVSNVRTAGLDLVHQPDQNQPLDNVVKLNYKC